MSIHTHGIYKAGAIHIEQPLALPENTKVELVISPAPVSRPEPPPVPSTEAVPADRPAAPQRISNEELHERIKRYGVSVGSLPADFSREDIYEDHD